MVNPIPFIISEAVSKPIPCIIVLEAEMVVDPNPFINYTGWRRGRPGRFPIIPFGIVLEEGVVRLQVLIMPFIIILEV